ncbi:trypsin-like peptidase domain-containing protein [Alphaproteobacteria bacterium]|nr:trypsin-like peptidase domain-containing protein [Alphaproteobacteria bacterium]
MHPIMLFKKTVLFILFFVFLLSSQGQSSLLTKGFARVGEKTMPSVVSIAVLAQISDDDALKNRIATMILSPRKDLFGHKILNDPRRVGSLGSGFIINPNGYIVTNYHTVENAVQIKVTFYDDKVVEASLVGYDSGTDLAVLKVNTSQKLPTLSWADSDKIKIGEWAIALGNSYGLGPTLTAGVISSPSRDLSDPNLGIMPSQLINNFIQTDASINKGNSGGPLVDVDGRVIGVNFAMLTSSGGSDGVGLAIPSNMAKKIAQNIIDYGRVKRAWIGLSVQGVTKGIAKSLGRKNPEGALVITVTDNGPAKQSGIKSRDIILKINNKKIKDSPDVSRTIGQLSVGEMVTLEIWRGKEKKKIKVKLQEFHSHEDYRTTIKTSKTKLKDHVACKEYEFGVTSLTWQFRQRFNAENPSIKGVLISDMREGGWAEKNGIMVGDIILEINKDAISSLEDFKKKIKISVEKKDVTLFFVYRFGQKLFIALQKKEAKKN